MPGFGVVIAQILVLGCCLLPGLHHPAVGMVGSPRRRQGDGGRDHRHGGDGARLQALTRFVNAHSYGWCSAWSFLLMIGFSLVAEGFGFPHSEGHLLYAAIRLLGAHRSSSTSWPSAAPCAMRSPAPARAPPRRHLQADGGNKRSAIPQEDEEEEQDAPPAPGFGEEERYMVTACLSWQSVPSAPIMTPRPR